MNRQEQTRAYDKYKRNKEARGFYNSAAWKKCREAVLTRDHYLCQRCLEQKKITQADMVHHIVHLTDDWSKGLDMDNLESLCLSCHNEEHGNGGKQVSKKIKVHVEKANREYV
ncbi:HNH endonuclease [Paenibacillus phage Tadhana]|uniref:HNH endonuclease n=20 Tax=Fernvirus TaxID=2843380 RepID=A0A0C5AN43_9CAUD|nr:HNH endonuclease signature motif containing protein [Paenibacillus larvae]YP_009195246.1 HNH endonuclease [Paenibacillus phage HB10c2]YP_009198005.1 HNH endonuclease [Paenibacillus phage Diva]YP_009203270.1 HNH endonuclease [Paenibacillus phage Fern]YP_009593477.1 HNH endonuclease [Paenibacillus phage Willow]YP_009836330.1 HNH endonuclease [Paenibacillus phage BN12]YP_009836409.1 HNH endonuclease [Paenibacillus phage PBL1c]YP_009836479.1 HNH endonuclease [Paenibacillus phage Pagassa]YP_0